MTLRRGMRMKTKREFIRLPHDVASRLLVKANKAGKTVSDYLFFLIKGDNHPQKATQKTVVANPVK